jgi:hypothetical protein
MKKIKTLVALLFIATSIIAQDSTKVISHEIGFNTVRILSQLSFLKSSEVAQLPYDVFYNIYFKKKVGIRLGAGSTSTYNEIGVNKQQYPRINKSNNINLRVGIGYNFSANSIITLNAFSDFIYERINQESVISTTVQTFPNPVVTRYEKNSNVITGLGFRVGAGINCKIYKQLSLYFEVPFTFVREKADTNFLIKETGAENFETKTSSRYFNSFFTLPATVYLVLKF